MIGTVIARIIGRRSSRNTITTPSCTLTTIVFVAGFLTLVGSGSNSGTYGSTTGHADDSADITTTPATRNTSDC